MEKLYTYKEYIDKAIEANQLNKQLYIYTHRIQYEIDVFDFSEEQVEVQIPIYDTDGNQKKDKKGNLLFKTSTETIKRPMMVEKTETDAEGNKITTEVQSTHKETRTKEVAELLIAPVDYYVCYKDNYTDGTLTEDYEMATLLAAKETKLAENTQKAKKAVENGHIEYKGAEFETNAQTVGDLTATTLILQASGSTKPYVWLSKDDKAIELTVDDFKIIGNLIAEFKDAVWNIKYLTFKSLIEDAKTIEQLNKIEIHY